jgi:hypothetical protein
MSAREIATIEPGATAGRMAVLAVGDEIDERLLGDSLP